MTGSGMGCPDWPKCFGQWVPPTDVSELPENYQEIYKDRGYAETEFNAFKTWVEYINRLIGVLIGFFALLTVISSFGVRSYDKKINWLSIGAFVMVVIQGGIGAYVVRTNLQTGTITLHMIIALFILSLYIFALLLSTKQKIFDSVPPIADNKIIWIGAVVLLLTLIQIVMGTQIREQIDLFGKMSPVVERTDWISRLEAPYGVHKYFHYLIFLALGLWGWQMKELTTESRLIRNLILCSGLCVLAEAGLGIGMHRLGVPAVFQPLHLLFATLLFGSEFALIGVLILRKNLRLGEISTENQVSISSV